MPSLGLCSPVGSFASFLRNYSCALTVQCGRAHLNYARDTTGRLRESQLWQLGYSLLKSLVMQKSWYSKDKSPGKVEIMHIIYEGFVISR